MPTFFSGHSGIKLKVIIENPTEKFTNTWKLNNTLLNND
jgi:hypothetical protein